VRKGKAHAAARPGDFAHPGHAYPVGVNALMWWLLPIGVTALAVAWVMLRSRPARPAAPDESMEALRRMQLAMEKPLPGDVHRERKSDS
jgi:hypothetical protein